MNLYLDHIPGLCNVNVVPASSFDAVLRDFGVLLLVEPMFDVYILREGDEVYTTPSNTETILLSMTCKEEGCLDDRWFYSPGEEGGKGLYSDVMRIEMTEEELKYTTMIHLIAKSSLLDDILTTSALDDMDYDVESSYYEIIAAHRRNGTIHELLGNHAVPVW